MHRRAFTLLELLTVLAIVAVLVSLAIGAGARVSQQGKAARARAELESLAAALESFKRREGDYPRTTDAAGLLQALIGRRDAQGGASEQRACIELAHFTVADDEDPFTDSHAVLVDPWDAPYGYAYAPQTSGWAQSGYVLYSLGPDGEAAPLPATGWVDDSAAANRDNLYATQ
jgi:general secretion pathway protein G